MSDNQVGARVVGIQLVTRAMRGPSRGESVWDASGEKRRKAASFAAGENSKVRTFVGRSTQRACIYGADSNSRAGISRGACILRLAPGL